MASHPRLVLAGLIAGTLGMTAAQASGSNLPAPQPKLDIATRAVPIIDAPEVNVPPVEVPQLPVPPTPPLNVPRAPVQAAPEIRAPAPGSGGAGGPAQRVSPGGAGRTSGAGAGYGGGSASTGLGGAGGQGAGATRAAHKRVAAKRRKFRRRVLELAPCFYALPRLERGALVLRAGLGKYRPHSSRATARLLEVAVRTVVRAERRGLRTLAAENRFTGCGTGGAGHVGAPLIIDHAYRVSATGTAIAGAVAAAKQRDRDRGQVLGQHASSKPSPAAAGLAAPPGASLTGADEGVSPTLLPMLLLGALALAIGLLALRRPVQATLGRRSERASERREQALVAAAHDLLRDRGQPSQANGDAPKPAKHR
jgi:hypothetical protein